MSYEVFVPSTDSAVTLPYPFPGYAAEEQQFNAGLTQIGAISRPARVPFPRWAITTDHTVITTGQQFVVAVPLFAGDVITNIACPIGATAGGTLTHSVAGLYSTNGANTTLTLLSGGTDQTAATWAANTIRDFVLTTPYTVVNSGIYYASISVTGTTMPSFVGVIPPIVAGSATGWSISSQQQPNLGSVGGSGIAATMPASITVSGYTVLGTSTVPVPYLVCH